MDGEKEKKEKGNKKEKRLKSNKTKPSSTNNKDNGKAKAKERNSTRRSSVVKSSGDASVIKKPDRVRRTNRRLASRGRKAGLSNNGDLEKSKRSIKNGTTGRRLVSPKGRKATTTKRPVSSRKMKTSAVDKTKTKKTKGSKTKGAGKNLCSVCQKAASSMGGMCQHNFCFRCFKSLLSKPLESTDVNNNNHIMTAPTTGKCPKCSREVQKFQMRSCKDGKIITEQLAFADHKRMVKDSPIAGKVFVPKGNDPKFCFDQDQPYIDVKDSVETDMDSWVLNDGYPVQDRLVFEEGCFFDKETRTFHGTVKWPVTFRGAYQWDVVLAFKKRYKAMDVAIIHERKERVLDEDIFKGKSDEEVIRLQYPFDGDWELSWKNANNEEKIAKVTVRNNQFQRGRYLFNLNMSDPAKVFFRWPLDLVTAEATSGANLASNPLGPEIGDVVSWKTFHPDFPEGFTWERLTIGGMPIQETFHFGGRSNPYVAQISKELVSSTINTAYDSETCSESNSGGDSASDDDSESDDDDESLRGIMRTPAIPLYYDFDFQLLSLNNYHAQELTASNDNDKTKSRSSVIGAVQDPLLRDLFSS